MTNWDYKRWEGGVRKFQQRGSKQDQGQLVYATPKSTALSPTEIAARKRKIREEEEVKSRVEGKRRNEEEYWRREQSERRRLATIKSRKAKKN